MSGFERNSMGLRTRRGRVRAIGASCVLWCGAFVGLVGGIAAAEPLPSLDEMLGLEDTGGDDGDAQRELELERALTAEEAADALSEAVRLMEDSASRLGGPEGTGLVTQRLQEDALRKLDAVIESAEQNQGPQGGSSSSSSQQQQQQQQQSNPGQQRSGGQQQQANRGSGDQESTPPAGADAALGPQRQLDAAAWGALPDRLRGALEQGLGESYSSVYRRLTEAYYRRLAEEAEAER